MTVVRRSAALLLGLALLVPTPGAAAAAGTGPWPLWDAPATGEFRSLLVTGGEAVWTNGVMQSRGANADGLHHEDYWGLLAEGGTFPYDERQTVERHLTWGAFGVDRWATDGDQELPTDAARWPDFTGELAEVRLATDADELFVRFTWTSMPAPDAQIATLALATDGSAPQAAAWPHGSSTSSPWSVALTTWGNGATVTAAGAEPVDLAGLGGEVRTGDHVVEMRVPRSLLPPGPWRLWGGGGLASPDDPGSWWAVPAGSATATSPGSGSTSSAGSTTWSLLFADDDPWIFTARREGDLLVGDDVTEASLVLDPALLDAGGATADPPRSGWLARYHRSAFDFGDGITKGEPAPPPDPFVLPPEVPLDDVGRSFEYTGRLQPYGMYVPAAYHERAAGESWPLVLYLHGLNNFYYEPHGTLFNLPDVLEERGYLFANLLGRGDLSYLGRGELDVLEVLADIREHYDVDPDRVHLMGHSMGSIGSHNVATRNPDLFASAAPAQITSSDDLIANLRHVPWIMVGGVEDFLDPGSSSEVTTYGLMSDLGYDVTFYSYLLKTHESTSISDTLPAMFDLFDRTRRVTSPGEFTYTRLPGDDDPDLGLVHDRAYQASGLEFADPSASQRIDVTSFAIPHAPLDPGAATRTRAQVDEGGPSGRSVADKSVTVPGYGEPVAVRNAAAVTLDNVAAVTLDLPGLGLEPIPGMTVEVEATDAVALTFAGVGAGQVTFLVDGAPVAARVAGTARSIDVPAGTHVVTIVSAAPVAPPVLPATGGGAAIALGLCLAGVGVRGRRRL